jgi:hypothetical protein
MRVLDYGGGDTDAKVAGRGRVDICTLTS